jgi:hypothetical protein
MRHRMSLKSRQELLSVTAPRYQAANKKQKQQILDEFVAATGYHRHYASPLLKQYQVIPGEESSSGLSEQNQSSRGRKPVYTDEVKQALIICWEAACRICAKRLVPFLPLLVPILEKYRYLDLSPEVREKLLAISPATVDRLLFSIRHGRGGRGIGTTQPGGLLKHQIPIRTFSEWNDLRPGFIEADLVAHCGTRAGGSHLYTLVFTDVATAWMEFKPLLFRDQDTTVKAIDQLRQQQPFVLLGLDTDNGTEFLNYTLLNYCQEKEITFTRARAYKKNDQCYIEQKNGSVVRKFIGYDRFEGLEPCRILEALYAVLRLYVNFFQPSVKLVTKKRTGSHVHYEYDKAQTPYQRVMAAETIPDDVKARLSAQFTTLDPVALLGHIDRLQDELWRYAYRQRVTTLDGVDPDAANAERQGVFQRPTSLSRSPTASTAQAVTEDKEPLDRPQRLYRHQMNKYQGERWWRTHPDAFADIWPAVVQQLEQMPDLQVKELFRLIQRQYPGQFKDSQLRSFQRRIRTWRQETTLTRTTEDNGSHAPGPMPDDSPHLGSDSYRRVTFVEGE